MKHEQVMNTHSSSYIPRVRMGKGDNSDCAGGFKPSPPYHQNIRTRDTDLKRLSLHRDRTKLVCHCVAILSFLKSNINFIIMCDTSARQPNNLEEEQLSFG